MALKKRRLSTTEHTELHGKETGRMDGEEKTVATFSIP
jgi:hypothetical protein